MCTAEKGTGEAFYGGELRGTVINLTTYCILLYSTCVYSPVCRFCSLRVVLVNLAQKMSASHSALFPDAI